MLQEPSDESFFMSLKLGTLQELKIILLIKYLEEDQFRKNNSHLLCLHQKTQIYKWALYYYYVFCISFKFQLINFSLRNWLNQNNTKEFRTFFSDSWDRKIKIQNIIIQVTARRRITIIHLTHRQNVYLWKTLRLICLSFCQSCSDRRKELEFWNLVHIVRLRLHLEANFSKSD